MERLKPFLTQPNPDLLLFLAVSALKTGFFLGAVMGFTAFLTWVERKLSSLMQDRIGPNRAAVFGLTLLGLFHPIADGIKLMMKEDFVPARADKVLFTLAPVMTLVPVLAAFAVIPFGDYIEICGYRVDLVIARLPLGLLYVLAVSGLAVYGTFLAGWASKSNFALLGALRGAAQMISYEVTLGLTLAGLMMVYGTADLQQIVLAQGRLLYGFIPAWGIVYQFPAFLLFLTAAMAENKRTPFDVVEGESEIIGYFMEYSSMRFAVFMFAEFIEIILVAMLAVTLFLGGWQIPYLGETGFLFPGGRSIAMPHYATAAAQTAAFAAKTAFMCWALMTLRWTVPRFRFDQVMRLAWQGILPLSLLNILATGLVLALAGKL
ncbi:MAG: complex I subunit 1 family protein [Elusimicrobiales bacterium]|jgi:NADH-quinone oxidoreductase subunit H